MLMVLICCITSQELNVLTIPSTTNQLTLKFSEPGTPMNKYYHENMHDNDDSFVANVKEAKEAMLTR
jgi:hypothetical protein